MWPPYQQPTFYPMYPPTSVPPEGNKEYIRYLRKELKMAKNKDPKKEEKKEEKKDGKEFWKKANIVGIAIFTAPFTGAIYLLALKLSWMAALAIMQIK